MAAASTLWTDELQPYADGFRSLPYTMKDQRLLEVLNRYRQAVAKQYRVIPHDPMERLLPRGKYLVSPKVDGELWFLVKQQGEVAFCAYNGRVLLGTALGREAAERLSTVEDIVLAGELFAVPEEGRPRSYHVGRALGEPQRAPTLRFNVFDLVREGETDALLAPFARRLERLEQLLGKDGGERLRLMPQVEAEPSEAAAYFREWVESGLFEGLVLRSEQGITFKVKPFLTLDAVVVAFGERVVNGVAQMRELSVALQGEDGNLQLLGTVGGGFSEADRVAWQKRLTGCVVESSFRLANREGTLCRFVRPETVIEIRCSDLLDRDSNDVPMRRMALSYSPETGYAPLGERRIVAMLHPVFLRERTDKVPDWASVGLTQVTRSIALDLDPVGPGGVSTYQPPETVRRGVWVKGDTAVRKYVVLSTKSGDRAPFLLFATDYSAGRAEPLKTTLRTASDLPKIEQQIAEWLTENVKKRLERGGRRPHPRPHGRRAGRCPRARRGRAEEDQGQGQERRGGGRAQGREEAQHPPEEEFHRRRRKLTGEVDRLSPGPSGAGPRPAPSGPAHCGCGRRRSRSPARSPSR